MSGATTGEPPLIPPDEFVTRWNVAAMQAGQPFRSALDPLVMLAWHLATERDRSPQPITLPGI